MTCRMDKTNHILATDELPMGFQIITRYHTALTARILPVRSPDGDRMRLLSGIYRPGHFDGNGWPSVFWLWFPPWSLPPEWAAGKWRRSISSPFLAAVFLLFSRSLTYEIRVASIITLCYLLGLGIILKLGMLSGGPIWLFTFLVLTSLFLGLKAASCALVVNGATLSITGWAHIHRAAGAGLSFFSDSPLRASISGINFLILNAITAISIHIMIRGLKEMAQKEHIASARLGREKRQLMDAHAKLNKRDRHSTGYRVPSAGRP